MLSKTSVAPHIRYANEDGRRDDHTGVAAMAPLACGVCRVTFTFCSLLSLADKSTGDGSNG